MVGLVGSSFCFIWFLDVFGNVCLLGFICGCCFTLFFL